jgi:hypothetical protein
MGKKGNPRGGKELRGVGKENFFQALSFCANWKNGLSLS